MQYPTYIKSVKSRRKKHHIKALIIFALIIFAVIKFNSVKNDIFGGDANDSDVDIEIVQGSSTNTIANLLKEKKIISYPMLFKLIAKVNGSSGSFQLGQHSLKSSMPYSDIISIISKPSIPSNAVTVTITEGSETIQTAQKLSQAFAEKGLTFNKEVFINECENGEFDFQFVKGITRTKNRLEGYLFPSTYTFVSETSERDVIIAMLNKFSKEYNEELQARATLLGMTTDDVITLASIIEREGASIEEFKTVSSVFNNRLKKKMKLESCATVQYVLGERKELLSVADTKVKSPYNTYLTFGLPVGPIASPGTAAIEAALYPADTEYLYFVLKDGKHVFSKTYREHQQAMKAGN